MRASLAGLLLFLFYSYLPIHATIHEAYLPAVTDCLPLKPIKKKPPKSKTKNIPSQIDSSYQWIPGYWHWETKKDKFEWVDGIWRRPPPNHHWIPGYWHTHKKHWVYVKGFWSPVAAQELAYLPLPPLEIKDESCKSPKKNSCWNPGYWFYNNQVKNYEWIKGKWSDYQQNGLQVPTHYRWYQKGYVCVPSFWDWPIEQRGNAYSCHDLAQQLLPCYPDYLYFYQYYTQTYPNFIDTCEWAPQWWGFSDCWSYSWNDHWNIWWCYTHPNYLGSNYLNNVFDFSLDSPHESLVSYMQGCHCPLFIGEQSPSSYDNLFSACEWTDDCQYPPIYWDSGILSINDSQTRRGNGYGRRISPIRNGTCCNENFALQWHYFCNRFYYRQLGWWFSLCRSGYFDTCTTCDIDEVPEVDRVGYERGVISNIALEQESQRVENFRVSSLLNLYGPINRCDRRWDFQQDSYEY